MPHCEHANHAVGLRRIKARLGRYCYGDAAAMRDQRMNARDLMSADTTAVSPETPLQDVARTLLAHRMSAVPVVEESGRLVGIISEGDLIGRKKTEREARREEWL